ncbi:MAG: phosphatase PAP2 family protein [Opitutaceae bacterium]|nr:phosphatase PAP2 family protein [Opitutaceae bacterium]
MNTRCLLPLLLLVIALAHTIRAYPEPGKFLGTGDLDVTKVIPAAPADNSLATAADVETVYQVQKRRTPEMIALANYFAEDSVFQYDAVIGAWFTASKLPRTAEFFLQIDSDRYAISSKGKQVWQRPRPPLLDSRIKPCVHLPKSGSYPSGHSTQAFLWANLLAEIFPEHRAALRERAELVAWSRIIGGVHYPTDITAGRMLGDRLAEEFLRRPAVREALAGVVEEVRKAGAKEHAAASATP